MRDNHLSQTVLMLLWFFGVVIAEHRFGEGWLAYFLPPLAWYRLMEFIYLALTSSICAA